MRTGGWLPARSGVRFYVTDPHPDDVVFDDFVFGISNECRFGGQIEFYSVAQHSVHVSELLEVRGHSPSVQLHGLLHDASEGYLKDLPRSFKCELPEYKAMEKRVMEAIYGSLHLLKPSEYEHRAVKLADEKLAVTEWRDFVKNHPIPPGRGEPWERKLVAWSSERARQRFRARYLSLRPGYSI